MKQEEFEKMSEDEIKKAWYEQEKEKDLEKYSRDLEEDLEKTVTEETIKETIDISKMSDDELRKAWELQEFHKGLEELNIKVENINKLYDPLLEKIQKLSQESKETVARFEKLVSGQ